ncbi:protein-L-isoaspartate(D-aspartate) O-methyltransferase [Nocardiopsis dassonvillei]|uniref:methyltransferase domain-containing protein n=1 Tax=Nocardiopsis dassonvillei TaxID=2014 RepID=UPI0020A39FFB|nr:methyltransferase domain-containing protein [Nocardiopsis dassonvillei]MCP3015056.1 protein-L-isoaspartate(D-aspartate) O-methyltransferase [Nocardiopsis dassonvillei]
MTDLDALHSALVDRIDTPEPVREAFAAHPRHRFIPDMVWPDATGLPLYRTADPDRWTRLVYGIDAVTTQANDGGSGPRNEPSSSSSAPQVMADMMVAAGVGAGMRVLEIGTGTGWNAAILSQLVGGKGSVTSIEIDPAVAALARERLTGTGVIVRTAAGPPAGEVYDAVIATCAATRIPEGWFAATDQGASLVLPWSPHPAAHSTPITALMVDGKRAAGAFVREAAFMRDRTQRSGDLPFPGLGQPRTPLDPFPVGSVELIGSGMMTQLMLMLPGVRLGTGSRPFQGEPGRIVWLGAGSAWAYLWPDGTVTGGGNRSLSVELADAYRRLQDAGLPALGAFTLEAGPERVSYRVTCASIDQCWEHPVAL